MFRVIKIIILGFLICGKTLKNDNKYCDINLQKGLKIEKSLFNEYPELKYIYFNQVKNGNLKDSSSEFNKILDSCILEFKKRGEQNYIEKINRIKKIKKAITKFRDLLHKYPIIIKYKKDLNLIDDLLLNRKTNKAIEQILVCLKKYPSKKDILNFRLAIAHTINGATYLSFDHLSKINIKKSEIKFLIGILNCPYFYPMLDDPKWIDLQKKIVEKIKNKKYIIDLKLAQKLWKMHMEDQWIRLNWMILSRYKDKEDINTVLNNLITPLITKIDNKNKLEIQQILKHNAEKIKKEIIGYEGIEVIFIIVQHSMDLNLFRKFLILLEKICEKDPGQWSNYILLYDRIKKMENKKQRYGTQPNYDTKIKKYVMPEIEYAENVNFRRYNKGIYQPIQNYLDFINKMYLDK